MALSHQRRRASGRLRVAVEACLQGLAMAHSRFDVRIGWERASDDPASVSASLAVPADLAEELGASLSVWLVFLVF